MDRSKSRACLCGLGLIPHARRRMSVSRAAPANFANISAVARVRDVGQLADNVLTVGGITAS